jgi:hypothetical protein
VAKKRNFIDLTGVALKLYGPILGGVLESFPEIEEIRISGLCTAPDVRTYDAEGMACRRQDAYRKIGSSLETLCDPVSCLIDSCPPLGQTEEPLGLKGRRTSDGTIVIRVILTCGRSSAWVTRDSWLYNGGYTLYPAIFTVSTLIGYRGRKNEGAELAFERLSRAASHGFASAVTFCVHNNYLLCQTPDAAALNSWTAEFPSSGAPEIFRSTELATVSSISVQEATPIRTTSGVTDRDNTMADLLAEGRRTAPATSAIGNVLRPLAWFSGKEAGHPDMANQNSSRATNGRPKLAIV